MALFICFCGSFLVKRQTAHVDVCKRPRGSRAGVASGLKWHGRSVGRTWEMVMSEQSGMESRTKSEFGGMEVDEGILLSLRASGIDSATPIQSAVMQRIVEGKSAIVHAETGSGKTLAYLLPIIVNMKRKRDGRRALIVVPSRELALQVYLVAAKLLAEQPSSVILLEDNISDLPPPDTLIVGTAKIVQALSESNPDSGFLQSFRVIVMDEIDRMLGTVGKHAPRVDKLRRKKHPKPLALLLTRLARERSACQLIAASATVGRPLKREIASLLGISTKENIPVVRPEMGSEGVDDQLEMVRIPESIRHICVPIFREADEDKLDALAEALVQFNPKKPLVFINRRARVNDVVKELRIRGWTEAIPLHEAFGYGKDETRTARIEKYEELLDMYTGLAKRIKDGDGASRKTPPQWTLPILVAGEMTARGLHVSNVDFVFLVDCPDDQNEYQHLAGRTGRMGKEGTVVSICSYRKAKVMNAWQSQMRINFERRKFEGLS